MNARAWLFLILVTLYPGCVPAPRAQTSNVPNWAPLTVYANKTIALGTMDSTDVVDMTNHRNLTILVRVNPPAGAAEPWALVGIRAIGCVFASRDSNSSGIMALQPVADRSYLNSGAGDSLSYGAFALGTQYLPSNGVVMVRGARPGSSFAYPHSWVFSLSNKGQDSRIRYVYFQLFSYASGGGGAPRVNVVAERSN